MSEGVELSGRASAIVLGAVVVVVGGVLALAVGASSGGQTLLTVELGTGPTRATLGLHAPATVQVWADLEVEHEGFSINLPNDELPHVVDYEVLFETSDGSTGTLVCNPFDSHFARTSSSASSLGQAARRSYDGRLEGCSVSLPAGTTQLRARLAPVGAGDARIRFQRTHLVLRVP